MKIAVHVPVWGRHKALALFQKSCEKNQYSDVFAITSNKTDRLICQDYGFKVLRHPNQPFLEKLQAGVDFAREFDFDALLMMGSDDTLDGIEHYRKALESYQFVACADFSFVNIYNGKTGYWPGYTNGRRGEPIGAGRCFRRDLLDKLDWNLWRGAKSNYPDRHQWERVNSVRCRKKIFTQKDGVVLTDYKDNFSRQSFDKLFRLSNI